MWSASPCVCSPATAGQAGLCLPGYWHDGLVTALPASLGELISVDE